MGRGGRTGAFQLPGWEELDVDQLLSARIQRPVLVVKEADAGALAESRLGLAFYITLRHPSARKALLVDRGWLRAEDGGFFLQRSPPRSSAAGRVRRRP